MSAVFVVLAIWFVAIAAFVSGVALCAFRRIRTLENHIRKPLQRRIRQQAEMLRRVQDASAAHELFLAGLSHELRTPLSGIRGAVQLLQDTGLNSPQREYARMIEYASATVLEMVDDMLTYSRTQAGKIHTESVRFSVREMIDDMLSLQNINAQERGIALIRDVSTGVPACLTGDRGKLNQVLLNLIGNAVKFTEEGSVTVSVSIESHAPRRVHEAGRVRLRFSVRDTGVGIAPHEIKTIFEPFVQGETASQQGRQGTGLGLTICQRLVHAMGGDIQVDSVLHEGTCVVFHVDLDVAQPEPPKAGSVQGMMPSPRSRVVLVVEDDEINRLVCTRYLALAKHHPVAAADERQVEHLVAFLDYVPDVILMDVNLAGQSGIELALKMRTPEYGDWRNVPVIAMSADLSGKAQEEARAAGITAFLAKPFTAGQLSDALDAMVQPEAPDSGELPFDTVLVDHAWLAQEIDVLGAEMVFELLNIFRASAATTLQAMNAAVKRRDWRATADKLHRLKGSAANLGMQYVVSQARALHTIVLLEGGPDPAFIAERIRLLEVACHASADSVRAMLLKAGEQDVSLAAQGDD